MKADNALNAIARCGTPRRYKRRGAYMTMRESPQGMEASIGCAHMGGKWAGESSRCEDPAPTVGIAIRITPKGRPLMPPCAYHATHGDPGFYNDAARRVATGFE